MIKPAEFKKLLKDHEDCLPMLTLSEFFDGNTIEDSIAPNQYGYGRPSLAEIWGTLRKIEALPFPVFRLSPRDIIAWKLCGTDGRSIKKQRRIKPNKQALFRAVYSKGLTALHRQPFYLFRLPVNKQRLSFRENLRQAASCVTSISVM